MVPCLWHKRERVLKRWMHPKESVRRCGEQLAPPARTEDIATARKDGGEDDNDKVGVAVPYKPH